MKIIRSLLICLLLSCFFSCEEVVELGVEGRVIDPNSQPITGATIALSGPESQQTVSDTEGNFFIGDITAGTYQITIKKDGYKTHIFSLTVKETIATTTIILSKLGIQGTVVSQDGVAVVGADVTINDSSQQSAVTNSKGGFLFGNIMAGSYEVTISKDGYKTHNASVTITDTIVNINVVLKKLGIEGKVFALNGSPLAGAGVEITGAERKSTLTDSAGYFVFGNIPVGDYQITISKEQYKPNNKTIKVAEGVATIEIILEKEDAQTIFGIVLNAATNQPIANVQLTTSPPTYSVTTDSNGMFQFGKKLEPGKYVVLANTDGFEKTKIDVIVPAGEPAQADIKLFPLRPVLKLSESKLDFDTTTNNLELIIENQGTGTLNWNISIPSEPWIKLEKKRGTASPEMPDNV